MAVPLEREVAVRVLLPNIMKNKLVYIIFLFCFCGSLSFAQKTLTEVLKKYNTESVPYMLVDSLKGTIANVVLLDAREENEFKVSHLKNALFVGYEKFDLQKTMKKLPNKNTQIVVYCSLGVRSEDIAEQLKNKGYTKIYNLYGGIFEWKNRGNRVFSKGIETNKVHAFSKEWSTWLLKGEKVYE